MDALRASALEAINAPREALGRSWKMKKQAHKKAARQRQQARKAQEPKAARPRAKARPMSQYGCGMPAADSFVPLFAVASMSRMVGRKQ